MTPFAFSTRILSYVLDYRAGIKYYLVMKTKTEYFNINILRGASFVTSYPYTGTKDEARVEAKRLSDIHAGAVASVENKSGLVVVVVK